MKINNKEALSKAGINNLAFSFIEVIIVISIVVLLAVVGLNMSGSYKEKANNAKIVSDTDTLKNSFLSYYQQNNTLPNPGGNNNYFKDDGSYGHSGAIDNFGVAGFVTEDILAKAYLNYLPLDPKTNQFYAYGKTLDIDNPSFEIASVVWKNGLPETKLEGNYNGTDGTISLIREYNGPSFVLDKSKLNFPYNPEELLLTAKINSYSGDVKINSSPLQSSPLLGERLISGDTIEVPTSGYAEIHYSDGSTSMLEGAAKLVLADMSYKQENNLTTRIKLALLKGTLWTNATALDKDSEFDVFTADVSAAVRGTSFGVKAGTNSSNITVEVGAVAVGSMSSIGGPTNTNLADIINNPDFQGGSPFSGTSPGPILIPKDGESIIRGTLESPIGVNITNGEPSQNSVIINRIESPIIYLDNIKPYILSQKDDGIETKPTSTITFENRKGFGLDTIKLKIGEEVGECNIITDSNTNESTVICEKVNIYGQQELRLCKTILKGTSTIENCTQPIIVSEGVNFERLPKGVDTASLPLIVCNPGQKGFYYGEPGKTRSECVEVDQQLTASGFELVAYAPYDIENDFNLYLPDGSTGATATHDKFEVGGLVLDASGEDGFLKYEGGELERIVSGDFAIEMSVRIPTDQLKHYLFDGGNNFKFFALNNVFFFNQTTGDIEYTDKTFTNGFDTIYIKSENGQLYMKLLTGYWKSLGELNLNTSSITIGAFVIEIPSGLIYRKQLNNIINNIKVYK